jgi:hypothetical protein
MDDDVADRPGFTPAAGVGAALLDSVSERLPLGQSIVVDLLLHGIGYTRRL